MLCRVHREALPSDIALRTRLYRLGDSDAGKNNEFGYPAPYLTDDKLRRVW